MAWEGPGPILTPAPAVASTNGHHPVASAPAGSAARGLGYRRARGSDAQAESDDDANDPEVTPASGSTAAGARREAREKARQQRRETDAAKAAATAAEVFRHMDANGDGFVSFPELRQALMKHEPQSWNDPRKVRKLLKAMDSNGDGRIQYEELYAWLALHDDGWDDLRQSSLFQRGKGFALAIFNEGAIADSYDVKLGMKLGEGSFGSVCRAMDRTTGQERAVKSIPRANMDNNEIEVEMEVMQKLDHPHILRLYEVFQDYFNVYLVMEMCTGGPLFDRIVESHNFNERQAAVVMQQITGGIHYMHLKLVCHRDLKPENFLLEGPCPLEKAEIKIIDFGCAKRFRKGHPMTTRVGTPFYVAPQVLQGCYDQSCDLWSLGVIMYILLSGGPPFCGNTPDEITQSVVAGKYYFDPEHWDDISADGKELIDRMLMYDPQERVTAGQVVDHIWIKDHAPQAVNRPLQQSQLKNMRNFCGQNKLKKAALEVIAKGMKDDQILALKEMFQTLDANGDGSVTLQELQDGIGKIDVPGLGDNLAEVMQGIDADGSGVIDYTEFIAATLDKKHYEEESACWAAFHAFDRDGSGTIDRRELENVLQSENIEALVGASGVEKILTDCDKDGDGQISFREFVNLMRDVT